MFGTIVAPSDTKWGFRYSADDMSKVRPIEAPD